METSHREKGTGHTAAIFQEIPAMICDGLRCFQKPKIAGKCSILSQRVAGPIVNRCQSMYKVHQFISSVLV